MPPWICHGSLHWLMPHWEVNAGYHCMSQEGIRLCRDVWGRPGDGSDLRIGQSVFQYGCIVQISPRTKFWGSEPTVLSQNQNRNGIHELSLDPSTRFVGLAMCSVMWPTIAPSHDSPTITPVIDFGKTGGSRPSCNPPRTLYSRVLGSTGSSTVHAQWNPEKSAATRLRSG